MITNSCDNINGLKHFDSFLGYTATVLAYLFIMPSVYTLADIVVPRKIVKENSVRLTSISVADINAARKRMDSKELTPFYDGTKVSKTESKWMMTKTMAKYIISSVSYIVSIDVWLTKLNEMWIRLLSGMLKTNENFSVSYPLLLMSSKSRGNRLFNRRTNHNDLQQTVQSFVKNGTPRHSLMGSLPTTIRKSSNSLKLGLMNYESHSEKNRLILDKIWMESAKLNLPIYYNLCKIVQQELFDKMEKIIIIRPMCYIVSYFLSFIGIGHFFSKSGLKCWHKVLKKYFQYLQVILGIWTDETFDEYGLESLYDNMCFKDDDSKMSRVIRGSIGPRAILLQIFPILTIASVVILYTCGHPLFVFSEKLKTSLPKLICLNPFAFALEKEKELVYDRNEKAELNYWVVYIQTIRVFFLESRLLNFIFNFVLMSMAILLLYQNETANTTFLVLLTIVIFFAAMFSLVVFVYVGEALGIRDEDFTNLYRLSLLLFLLMVIFTTYKQQQNNKK